MSSHSSLESILTQTTNSITAEFNDYLISAIDDTISAADLKDSATHKALVLRYLSRWMCEVYYDDCGGEHALELFLEHAILAACGKNLVSEEWKKAWRKLPLYGHQNVTITEKLKEDQ